MKTVLVTNLKGGSGKTMITRQLAVAAGRRVAVIDLDAQRSLTEWLQLRTADYPALVTGLSPSTLADGLRRLAATGTRLVLIDTPPAAAGWVREAMRAVDLVLVPVRPSPDDLRSVRATIALLDQAAASFVFVLNFVKTGTRLAIEAVAALAEHGRVAPAQLVDRVVYAESALTGQGVTEMNDDKAADEVKRLYTYISRQLSRQNHA